MLRKKIQYGINRYETETKRLYQVLENRIEYQSKNGSSGSSTVGDKMTIADLASFAWVNRAKWAGVEVKEFNHLQAWQDRINARPAIPKWLDVPESFQIWRPSPTVAFSRLRGAHCSTRQVVTQWLDIVTANAPGTYPKRRCLSLVQTFLSHCRLRAPRASPVTSLSTRMWQGQPDKSPSRKKRFYDTEYGRLLHSPTSKKM